MTQVGHILVGAAVGVLCKPERNGTRWLAAYSGAFILLANIPDLPFKNWGHDRYDVSHSIFVSLMLIAMLTSVLAFCKEARDRVGGWSVFIGGTAAWLSHLLLDSFYNHGQGVAIFWPFSDGRLALPMPWFSVVTEVDIFTLAGLREYLTEFFFFTPFIAAALLLRSMKTHWQRSASEQ